MLSAVSHCLAIQGGFVGYRGRQTVGVDRSVSADIRPLHALSPESLEQVHILFLEYQASWNVSLCFQAFGDELAGLLGDDVEPAGNCCWLRWMAPWQAVAVFAARFAKQRPPQCVRNETAVRASGIPQFWHGASARRTPDGRSPLGWLHAHVARHAERNRGGMRAVPGCRFCGSSALLFQPELGGLLPRGSVLNEGCAGLAGSKKPQCQGAAALAEAARYQASCCACISSVPASLTSNLPGPSMFKVLTTPSFTSIE